MKIIILFLLLTAAFGAPGNGKSREMKKREMRSLGKKSFSMTEERTGTCIYPGWKGDGMCDDETNNSECDWDGGDCCGGNTDYYSYDFAYAYCTECLCLDPNYEGPNPNNEISYCQMSHWKGDGYCDDENNNSECDWDGGDCCGSDVDTSFCTECACLEA